MCVAGKRVQQVCEQRAQRPKSVDPLGALWTSENENFGAAENF
jgi:hypothetical protein